MSPLEVLLRRAVEDAAAALRRIEWSAQAGSKCPACSRPRAYGVHVCSCPINLAFRSLVKAGVEVPRQDASPAPASGPFALNEIPLLEWARWVWMEVTAAGDRRRMFLRGKERTPDEIAAAIRSYESLQAADPELFQQGAALP